MQRHSCIVCPGAASSWPAAGGRSHGCRLRSLHCVPGAPAAIQCGHGQTPFHAARWRLIESVPRHAALVAHAVQSTQDGVVAHGFFVIAPPPENSNVPRSKTSCSVCRTFTAWVDSGTMCGFSFSCAKRDVPAPCLEVKLSPACNRSTPRYEQRSAPSTS